MAGEEIVDVRVGAGGYISGVCVEFTQFVATTSNGEQVPGVLYGEIHHEALRWIESQVEGVGSRNRQGLALIKYISSIDLEKWERRDPFGKLLPYDAFPGV